MVICDVSPLARVKEQRLGDQNCTWHHLYAYTRLQRALAAPENAAVVAQQRVLAQRGAAACLG